jgi:hypothetical protein
MTHNEYSSSKSYAVRIRSVLRDARSRLTASEYSQFAEQFESELHRINGTITEYDRKIELTAVLPTIKIFYINSTPMMARSSVWQAAFFGGSGITPVGGVVNASGQMSDHSTQKKFDLVPFALGSCAIPA